MATRIPHDSWKYVYKKLQEGETVSRRQVQEIDNGFFEKFGSIVIQASLKAALGESNRISSCEEAEEDSLHKGDGDSEPELYNYGTGVDRYIEAVGWNIDELYQELLYDILHNEGTGNAGHEVGQLAVLSYVQGAFKISNEKHKQLLSETAAKKPPELLLNVEIVEAKDLPPNDPNGLSDPFVTIFMMSNPTQRFNSSVKLATLNPVWKEHFSLPMLRNYREDSLCLEVWDFDPVETAKIKMDKLLKNGVRGVRGFGKLMKEVAVTAMTGKDVNELMGSVIIPVNSIPPRGMTKLYNLTKKSKSRKQGEVEVRLKFTSEKDYHVAAQEHRHLLRILLLHELEISKVAPYWWSGNFSAPAEAILRQHAAQSGLSQQDNHLAQWAVFCAVTPDHPLSFALFNALLDKIHKPIKSGLLDDEDVDLFWDSTKQLLPYCYSHIKKPRKISLQEVLKILLKLSELEIPETADLFPKSLYSSLKDDKEKLSIHEVLHQAVLQGASDWLACIMENNECKDKTEESSLPLVTLIELVNSNLQNAENDYNRVFVDIMNVHYTKILYDVYESKISALAMVEVKEVCTNLKRLKGVTSTSSVDLASGINREIATNKLEEGGTKLFDLYRKLQCFSELGQNLNKAHWDTYSISKFHSWFFEGVVQWLDIIAYMAKRRVGKAVELDALKPVHSHVKYGSSSVDTLTVFFQIKKFWQQLAWPNVEECYMFLTKIVIDISDCLVFYSHQMASRVENIGIETTEHGQKFEVTSEWCVAINNMEYVRCSLEPFLEDLEMDGIAQKLSEMRSPDRAKKCKDTMKEVVKNSIDIQNEIVILLTVMVKKMVPSINRYLVEGAELINQNCSNMKRVMQYLEANFDTLYEHLNKENFSRTLVIVWNELGEVFYNLIQSNVKKRPPSFFANLHECLKIMIRSFWHDNKEIVSSEKMQRVEYLLKIYGMETRELIHQYHLDRWQEQQGITEPKMGILTVRAQFIDNDLNIEVINARNLMSTDSNGCNSYLQAVILPENTFANVIKPKTQVHSKNLFPLYDEIFTIPLTYEQRNTPDGVILFIIKSKDMFNMGKSFVGEAYLHFKEIPNTPVPLSSLPQKLLTLSRPIIDGDAIKALEARQGDKQAREFLKRQRQKIPTTKQFFSLG